MEKKITPCLWFDHEGEEAVALYTSVFRNGKKGAVARYTEGGMMPEGTVMTVDFSIAGTEFIALNGGPYFKITPAISFFIGCETIEELDILWENLSDDGMVLMERDKYPFSERYGWLRDKFGVTWQLGLCKVPQYIATNLMFVGKQHGKAEEAVRFYCSVFPNSSIESVMYFEKNEEAHETEGMVKHLEFSLNGQEFIAMDSGAPHKFTFTEGISLCVYCHSQAEIDRLWDTLSENGEQQPCGWVKDRFGVSWQITPDNLGRMMTDPDPEKSKRVMNAMLQMKKLDMNALQKAYDGK